jgi:predicted SprT family Zn-dependent metalloprotease
MARVDPFHSSKNPGVYHVCSKCTEGNNIERKYRKAGTGNGVMCKNCKDRISRGTC